MDCGRTLNAPYRLPYRIHRIDTFRVPDALANHPRNPPICSTPNANALWSHPVAVLDRDVFQYKTTRNSDIMWRIGGHEGGETNELECSQIV